jgi:hypothetical protein
MDQQAFASALLDPTLPVPDGVTSARGEGDAKRFAVYRNNVAVSLAKALGQRFPVVQRLVGDAFFNGMARAICSPRNFPCTSSATSIPIRRRS